MEMANLLRKYAPCAIRFKSINHLIIRNQRANHKYPVLASVAVGHFREKRLLAA